MGVLWLVCDVSGSMLESGKRFVVRGVVREVEQYLRLGYATQTGVRLVAWSKEVRELAWAPDEEVPSELLQCRGSADAQAIAELLASQPDDKFMILSDGFWTDDSRTSLNRWKNECSRGALRIIKVGADANPKLRDPDVFPAEDLFAALDRWLVR